MISLLFRGKTDKMKKLRSILGVRHMEIRHLTTFLQVAAMQSFTRAGEALGYSQANVSFQIRQLETELGVPLFDRIGRKAHLTQHGQMLIPHAQQIVSTATRIENLFREKETLGGTLRVGFVESLFECLFQPTILAFHRQFPRVTVEITVDATAELLKKLHTGQLDIVCLIDSNLIDPDILYWQTVECSIVIAANSSHPLAHRQDLSIRDLDGQEFVLMEDTSPYLLAFKRWLMREGIRIDPFLKVQSPDAALNLISQENYLAIVPDYSVKQAIPEGQIVRLEIPGFSQTQTVQFLVHKNKVITPQIEGFLHHAHTTFLKYVAEP